MESVAVARAQWTVEKAGDGAPVTDCRLSVPVKSLNLDPMDWFVRTGAGV
jgi:hypothetical protein